jgi:GntR family transcriptional regulator
MVDRHSGQPAYRQIADVLRERIQSGQLASGNALPSTRQLVTEFRVSDQVVRRAIEVLRMEGLIDSHAGKGVFVRELPPIRRLASDRYDRRHREAGRTPFMADTANLGPAHFEMTRFEATPAPGNVAKRLQLPDDALVLVQGLRFHAGRDVLQISTAYVPYELVDGTRVADPAAKSWERDTIGNLDSVGVHVDQVVEEIVARMPRPEERRALNVGAGVPVFSTQRTMLAQGRPVETCDIVMPADRYQLVYRVQVQ